MRIHTTGPFKGLWQHGYGCVLADPPWRQVTWGETNAKAPPYPTMSEEELLALDVNSLCAPNTHLFLWTTHPHLAQSIRLMSRWGFRYSTVAFTWLKTNKDGTPWRGMGKTTRKSTEIVLLGRLGDPPRYDHNLDEILPFDGGEPIEREIVSRRGAHSVKPEECRRRIERYAGPDVRKVELFARRNDLSPENNWVFWGNQVSINNGTPTI